MTRSFADEFENHFEVAERMGLPPAVVIAKFRAQEFRTYGYSKGVYYLPKVAGPHTRDNFERMIISANSS